MAHTHAKLIIIGSGPAGYTAAIYAARAMLEPVLISGLPARRTAHDHHRRGELSGLRRRHPGPLAHGADAPAGRACRHPHGLRPHHQGGPRPAALPAGGRFRRHLYLRRLIIATGAQAKWLGLPSEAKFQGFGVSACATCDGFFFRGKEVVVVGGGNTAVEEALYLAHLASKVTLVHRRDSLRAETHPAGPPVQAPERARWSGTRPSRRSAAPQTPPAVTHVRLKNIKTGSVSDCQDRRRLHRHRPQAGDRTLRRPARHEGRAAISRRRPDSTATNIPGVFAAGDVTDDVYRQAVTAAGMGCMAALEAERYLAALEATREAAE